MINDFTNWVLSLNKDLINVIFELGGSGFTFSNAYVLYKHKEVKGVNPFSTVYFGCWGIWNLFWYSHLNQPWSFYGGVLSVIASATWVSMLIYYTMRNKKNLNV